MAAKPKNPLKTEKDVAPTPDEGASHSETCAELTNSPQKEKTKKPTGRPLTFTQSVADAICVRLSGGESLRQIVKDDDMPAQSTVYEWLQKVPSFTEQYTRAREEQADTLADEIIAIADEQPEIVAVVDKKTGALIEHKLDSAFLLWQKNRIDARKWTAMKLKPKKYGDKIAVGGDEENPLKAQVDFSTFETLLTTLETRRQSKKANGG